MWTVFGGQPFRFSLSEFAKITGLPADEFTDGYGPFEERVGDTGEGSYWRELFGQTSPSLPEISEMLKSDTNVHASKKLRLALILLVDGFLIAKHQTGKPTARYANMLQDIDFFLIFPWAREFFLYTLYSMTPCERTKTMWKDKKKGIKESSVISFTHQMQQTTIHLQGFPLGLQLLALRSIHALLDKLPNASDIHTVRETTYVVTPQQKVLSLNNVLDAEGEETLSVAPNLNIRTAGLVL